ncbi:MAG: Protein N-acetyltransferase, RimJ/RimL family [Blastococcus sp.]|nr:Protein N-acetyltransferase, RimJ/RimL family [Blastococcus sp.]
MPALVPPVVTALPAEQPVLVADDLTLRTWPDAAAPALLAVYADPAGQRWHCEYLDRDEPAGYAEQW